MPLEIDRERRRRRVEADAGRAPALLGVVAVGRLDRHDRLRQVRRQGMRAARPRTPGASPGEPVEEDHRSWAASPPTSRADRTGRLGRATPCLPSGRGTRRRASPRRRAARGGSRPAGSSPSAHPRRRPRRRGSRRSAPGGRASSRSSRPSRTNAAQPRVSSTAWSGVACSLSHCPAAQWPQRVGCIASDLERHADRDERGEPDRREPPVVAPAHADTVAGIRGPTPRSPRRPRGRSPARASAHAGPRGSRAPSRGGSPGRRRAPRRRPRADARPASLRSSSRITPQEEDGHGKSRKPLAPILRSGTASCPPIP